MVEAFARGKRKARNRFRLVHLAVAEDAPDTPRLCVGETTMLQIAEETGLVDRRDRTVSHRAGGGLPKVGHQPGMGIEAPPPPAAPLPISLELLFRQPAFEKSARIDAWSRM